jgi:uncharacterized protein
VKAILPILFGTSAALLAPLGPIASAVHADGASAAPTAISALAIDCEAPASPNEVLVCTDADLLARDRSFARQAAASGENAEARLQWLRDQRDMCDSVACLRSAYSASEADGATI